jgi:hypothetical protein
VSRPPEPPRLTDDSAAALRQLIMGFRATQLVAVAARLGVADRLARGPRTARELAADVDAHPEALHRLLRALASLGVFAETADGAFALTPLAEPLRADAAGSLRATAVLYGDEWLWRAYGRLLHSVRTGRPAFDDVHGEPIFAYLDRHPAAEAVFADAMSGFTERESAAVAEAYDFSRAATVVDVGGGQGALVAALLRRHPRLSGVVYDRAPAVAEARRRLAEAGLAARARGVAGDFFAAVPPGGDVYLLKSVIHDWDDAAAVAILRRCRAAMADSARLLVAERVVPPGNGASEAKLFDVNMLVVTGGKERTEREHRALLAAAGLALVRVHPTPSPLTLLEAEPAATA